MCGRYTLTKDGDQIRKELSFVGDAQELQPRFNIAPSQPAPVLVKGRRLAFMRWGLVPSWAKDQAIGNRMINARSETVAEKPAFKRLVGRRHCLVLADGFYEWQKTGGGRQPWYFHLPSRATFAFAGLWDQWSSPDGSPLQSFTLLTTEADAVVRRIHERMPVILKGDGQAAWLDLTETPATSLADWLKPLAGAELEAYPVDRRVNSPQVEGPECVEPREGSEGGGTTQPTLF